LAVIRTHETFTWTFVHAVLLDRRHPVAHRRLVEEAAAFEEAAGVEVACPEVRSEAVVLELSLWIRDRC
jgi:hypothetical protein